MNGFSSSTVTRLCAIFLLLVLLSVFVWACAEGEETNALNPPEKQTLVVTQHTEFLTVDAREVAFGPEESEDPFEVPAARLFYTFIPADEDPGDKPLFVFVNGGPGGSTTAGLFLNGTAPYRLKPNECDSIEKNPASFTSIGNLLYIDPRMAGFSYDLSGCTDFTGCPSADPRSFHIYVDAGDLLFVVLNVLASKWLPADTPVVLIGESYGGARVTMMLNFLLSPNQLRDPRSNFRDPALGDLMEAHYRETLSEIPFENLSPDDVVEQFGRQVLIQPGGILQNDRTEHICDILSENDPRAPYCEVQTAKSDMRGETADVCYRRSESTVTAPAVFETLFGARPESVPGLPASDRQGAFRIADSSEDNSPFIATLGSLPSHDAYYRAVFYFDTSTTATRNASDLPFRRNLGRVKTFVTDAYYDPYIATFMMPAALLYLSDGSPNPTVLDAATDFSPREGIERPGQMSVTFSTEFAAANGLASAEITVRMPRYMDAGHMVAFNQAEDLREDIANFL